MWNDTMMPRNVCHLTFACFNIKLMYSIFDDTFHWCCFLCNVTVAWLLLLHKHPAVAWYLSFTSQRFLGWYFTKHSEAEFSKRLQTKSSVHFGHTTSCGYGHCDVLYCVGATYCISQHIVWLSHGVSPRYNLCPAVKMYHQDWHRKSSAALAH